MKVRTHLTLSRRNLLTLLSKMDRVRDGGLSLCTIIKPGGPHGDIVVTGAEDDVVYKNREPGYVMPWDNPSLKGTDPDMKIKHPDNKPVLRSFCQSPSFHLCANCYQTGRCSVARKCEIEVKHG